MPFQLFPIQIVGPFYEDESLQYSSQKTVNLFPSIPIEGRTIRALHWWPGTKLFYTTVIDADDEFQDSAGNVFFTSDGQKFGLRSLIGSGNDDYFRESTGKDFFTADKASFMSATTASTAVTGSDRGMDAMAGILYRVVGTSLYSVARDGTHTSRGTIVGGHRVDIKNDGTNLIVSTGAKRYQYSVAAGLTEITDSDHQPGNTTTFLNRQMVMDGAGGQFQVANVGDPDSIGALNFATAESAPDDTLAVAAFDELVHIFGTGSLEGTVETWENTGVGNPPFEKIRGATKQFGLAAIHSIAKTDQHLYCLSSNRSIYRIVQIDFQDITPTPMADFLKNNRIDDAFGIMIKFGKQFFYVLSFPEADVTWVIPTIDPNSAFQLETGVNGRRYLISSYTEVYGKKLVSDWRNSNIYEFDFDTYTNFNENEGIVRERITSPINAAALDLPGREVTMRFAEFLVETGVGNPDDPDPVVQLSASFDNGRSYTNETTVKLGQAGEKETVRLDLLRTFKDVQFKIRYAGKTRFSLHGAGISAKLSGKL